MMTPTSHGCPAPRADHRMKEEQLHVALEEGASVWSACFALRLESIGVCSTQNEHSEPFLARMLDAQVDFLAALPGVGPEAAIELRFSAHPNARAEHCGRIDVLLRVQVEESTREAAESRARSAFRGLYPNLVAIHETYQWVPIQSEPEYTLLFDASHLLHFGEVLRREAQVRLAAIDPLPRNRPIGFSSESSTEVPPESESVHVYAPFVPTFSDLRRLFDILLLQRGPTVLSIVLRPTTLQASELDFLLEQSGRCEHFLQRDVPHALPLRKQVDLLVSHFTDTMFSLRDDCFWMAIRVASRDPLNASLVEAFGTTITGHVASHDALRGPVQPGVMKGGYDWTLAAAEEESHEARTQLGTLSLRAQPDRPDGRLRSLFTAREANCAFRFPLPRANEFPGLPTRRAVALPPPPTSPAGGVLLGENLYRGMRHPIHMLADDRRRHTYIVGQTGTGKSSLLRTMILQDIQEGKGVAVLDPHGELIDDLLPCIPPERVNDVYYVSPERQDLTIGINMLEYEGAVERDAVINNLLEIFQRLYRAVPESMGPAFEQYFRNAVLLEMADPEAPPMLDGVLRIFTDADYRQSRLEQCGDPLVLAFWTLAKRTTGDASLANFGQYIVNKLSRFLYNDTLRRILLQPKSTIQFKDVLDKSGILLVDLCKGRLGEMNTAFLAMAIIGQIQRAAFSRTSVHDKSRLRDFYLYIDEFQNVATDSFITILSEARKYRLNAILTNQYLHQIPDDIIEAVRGNVGTVVAFRTGCKDAELLSEEFAPSVQRDDLLNLPNFHAYVTTLTRGEASAPFSLRTQIWEVPRDPETVQRILRGMIRYTLPSHRADALVADRWRPQGTATSSSRIELSLD